MNQRLISEIGRSQRLAIINQLKRTQGLSVNELSERLKMSYMGVKQHCVDLAKERYLDTWRRPVPIGRPEMVYRLTQRAHELFPATSNEATIEILEASRQLFGPSSPEKLLFLMFQRKAERYAARIKSGALAERGKWLARLRDADGHMANFEDEGGLRIVEHHCPIRDLLAAFPLVARLETEMFQRLLNSPVRREEANASGLFCCTFHIGG